MKAQVVFDNNGHVVAILHLSAEIRHGQQAGSQPLAVIRAQAGQQIETLQIPDEMKHLSPLELHNSVKVDISDDSPRLVFKTKEPARS